MAKYEKTPNASLIEGEPMMRFGSPFGYPYMIYKQSQAFKNINKWVRLAIVKQRI